MNEQSFNRVPAAEVLAVTESELAAAFIKITEDWNAHLKEIGIKLPTANTAKWYQLTVLKHFEFRAVHKQDVARLIAKLTDTPATDQQIRHLSTQGGWFILNRNGAFEMDGVMHRNPPGCHVLITTRATYPNSTFGRRQAVSEGDWQTILRKYDNTCASCGAKNGAPHRFDSNRKTVLEKGHMNPNKPLAPGNIIPQCGWCNRTARNDFTFDEQGRPRAVASIRPVKRANEKVKREIKQWLNKQTK